MKFKQLDITGFKSFSEKTKFLIEDGLTGIVGPNGCGKSNIVEALRWCMGESSAKSMRGSGMEDVIFSGTSNRPSKNISEVALMLDNQNKEGPAQYKEFDEVLIKRKIEKDKGSKYYINDKEVRARDVQTLFADLSTGAHSPSLISQGRIGQLVTAKPIERKSILEEAAGISGIHARRQEAETRLNAAENNLKRADELKKQQQKQLDNLKKQAEEATRYKEISREIKKTEAGIYYLKIREIEKDKKRIIEKLSELDDEISAINIDLNHNNTLLEEENKKLSPLRDKKMESAARLQKLNLDMTNLIEEEGRVKSLQEKLEKSIKTIESDLEREKSISLDAELNEKRVSKEKEELLEDLKHSEELAQYLSTRLDTIEKELNKKQKKIAADATPPRIIINETFLSGEQFTIVGYVSDNVEVAELSVDGDLTSLNLDGSFSWQRYVPLGKIQVDVVAIDLAGNKRVEQVVFERKKKNYNTEPELRPLNPLASKRGIFNSNSVALIFGVERYAHLQAQARHAENDAKLFYDFAITKLGVPPEKVKLLLDSNSKRLDIKRAVKNWLLQSSIKNETAVFVFFAGHGLSSQQGDDLFLIPFDGETSLLQDSAISVRDLYSEIQKASPKSVVVFLDTCFSGASRGGQSLIPRARPVMLKPKKQSLPANFSVISATGPNQISRSLKSEPHGLFSYFLMRGLEGEADANKDNKITVMEAHKYVKKHVSRYSGFKQVPELSGDPSSTIALFENE